MCAFFIYVLLACVLGDKIFNNYKNNDSYRLHPTKRHSRSRSKQAHNFSSKLRDRKESRRYKKKKNLQENMINGEVSTIAYEQGYQKARESVIQTLVDLFQSLKPRSSEVATSSGMKICIFLGMFIGLFTCFAPQSVQRKCYKYFIKPPSDLCKAAYSGLSRKCYRYFIEYPYDFCKAAYSGFSRLCGYVWIRISFRRKSLIQSPVTVLPQSPPTSRSISEPPCPSLPNIGSTCFFNSTLQVLLTTKDKLLTDFGKAKSECVHEIKFQNGTKSIKLTVKFGDKPMTSAFLAFLQAVKGNNNISAALRHLHSEIGKRYSRFSTFNQQDSEEVLRCLLDGIRMEEIEACRDKVPVELKKCADLVGADESEKAQAQKECLRATYKLNTLVDKIFGGSCVNTVICRQCETPLQLIEPFIDLSVPMPDGTELVSQSTGNQATNKVSECSKKLQGHLKKNKMFTTLGVDMEPPSFNSLENCLKLFTSLDILDEDNKFICDHCTDELRKKGGSNEGYAECLVSKQLLIHKLPPILILHMKRFHLGVRVTKNNNHIEFPDMLDVAPYCSSKISPEESTLYDLYGVVQHSGSLHGGHYIAYVKYTAGDCEHEAAKHTKHRKEVSDGGESGDSPEDVWCFTSDSYVKNANETEVHDCQAYLLLYVQRR